MTTEDKWAITAYHECSHATAYLHFQWKFGSIRLYEKDGEVLGAVTSPAGTYDPIARAIICLSGPIAEERVTGIPFDEQPGAGTDLQMARNSLGRLDTGPPQDLESLVPFTRLLVESNWPLISQLATQLLIANELSYDEVVSLIR